MMPTCPEWMFSKCKAEAEREREKGLGQQNVKEGKKGVRVVVNSFCMPCHPDLKCTYTTTLGQRTCRHRSIPPSLFGDHQTAEKERRSLRETNLLPRPRTLTNSDNTHACT